MTREWEMYGWITRYISISIASNKWDCHTVKLVVNVCYLSIIFLLSYIFNWPIFCSKKNQPRFWGFIQAHVYIKYFSCILYELYDVRNFIGKLLNWKIPILSRVMKRCMFPTCPETNSLQEGWSVLVQLWMIN